VRRRVAKQRGAPLLVGYDAVITDPPYSPALFFPISIFLPTSDHSFYYSLPLIMIIWHSKRVVRTLAFL
jgi:hypothetical protein